MPITAKAGANVEFKRIAPWTYPARCIRIIDLGTHETEWKGKKRDTHEVMIGFEFPTELDVFNEEKWEEPFFLSKYFTLSLGEKANLRKFLENWRGKAFTEDELKGFDLEKLIWVPALVNVIEVQTKSGDTRSVIGGATTLPKGMEVPAQINDSLIFSLEENAVDQTVLEKLWEKTQEKIKWSNEYKALEAADVFK